MRSASTEERGLGTKTYMESNCTQFAADFVFIVHTRSYVWLSYASVVKDLGRLHQGI